MNLGPQGQAVKLAFCTMGGEMTNLHYPGCTIKTAKLGQALLGIGFSWIEIVEYQQYHHRISKSNLVVS
jgi:hypothetical protein